MKSRDDQAELTVVQRSGCVGSCCDRPPVESEFAVSRRRFLQGVGAAGVAVGGLALVAAESRAASAEPVPGEPFPRGKSLRLKPILVHDLPDRKERTSWRGYGGIHTREAAQEEAGRIKKELREMKDKAEFPVELQPIAVLDSQSKLAQALSPDADMYVVYAAGACTEWPKEAQSPMVMFVRHRSGPFYLGFEIAHWRFLRESGDQLTRQDFGPEDVVVDSYDELLWRARALYGLKNAKGTKMLTIGGLCAYSREAQENGPRTAKEVWGYDFVDVSNEQFAQRLGEARNDPQVVKQIEERTASLLAMPNITLATERKFVFNSYMALHVCREFLKESGCSNFGFSQCMGQGQISMLDTPACFVLSLANDEGHTAYCHTDLSHTMPGVLLRWIASRPAFVCNSHCPHDGLYFVAHCQAPRRMNGRDYEPATIMTHYESDYGAACKTHYTKDQVVTAVIPNLRCTKWQAFRGKIVGAPSYPACRSQMEIEIDGDWKRLLREMEGFHTQIVYGDYTREVGYALRKLGRQIEWDCFS
jgi:hypothetical protein